MKIIAILALLVGVAAYLRWYLDRAAEEQEKRDTIPPYQPPAKETEEYPGSSIFPLFRPEDQPKLGAKAQAPKRKKRKVARKKKVTKKLT